MTLKSTNNVITTKAAKNLNETSINGLATFKALLEKRKLSPNIKELIKAVK
jgi:hypothetical protein